MRRLIALTLSLVCFTLVHGWAIHQLGGQEVATKVADAAAPKRINANIAAMAVAPPNAERYADDKEARLRNHHRPTIELVAPVLPATALADPVANSTNVIGAADRATSNLQVIFEHALTDTETNDLTSTVTEPSVAVRGAEVLVTGNWFAAFSTNSGNTFRYVNPDSTFPTAAGGFCCDQVAIYVPSHDLMVWYLQYVNNAQGNVGRLAVATGNDITNQSWRYYDFSANSIGGWQNEWLDFPEIAVSNQSLYLTTNVFSTATDTFTRAVVLRLPLNELATYQGFQYRYYDTTQVGSIRPTLGATDTMYLGAHRNLNSIRVFTWPEANDNISLADVQVQTWANATRVAPGPDGKDWIGRADGRITAAAVTGGNIAFGWSGAQDGTYVFPHVRVALIDRNTKAVVAQPHIRNPNFAFGYPAFSPNSTGVLGVSLHYGGGMQLHPSHAVGVLDAGNTWNLIAADSGTNGPNENKWGDYLAVRPHGQNQVTWVATGFALHGGSTRQHIQVKYLHFGFANDVDDHSPDELTRLRQELVQVRAELQRILDRIDALNATPTATDRPAVKPAPAKDQPEVKKEKDARADGRPSGCC